jgi:uncharacterized protein (TIGR00369 family)
VIATLADHVAGGAARSMVGDASDVITIEFKINYLNAAKGQFLHSSGKVLKAGGRILVAESVVYSRDDAGSETLVAKCMETLAVQGPR